MKLCAADKLHKESVSYMKRKRVLVLSLLFFALFGIGLVFGINTACATDSSTGIDITTSDYYSLLELAEEQDEHLLNIVNIFTTTAPSEGNGPSLMYALMVGEEGTTTIGRIGRDVTALFGAVLVLAYATIQVLQMIQRENESIEIMMRITITAFIGLLVVIYIFDITTVIENIGGTVFNTITGELNAFITGAPAEAAAESAAGSIGSYITAEGFDAVGSSVSAIDAEEAVSSVSSLTTSGVGGFVYTMIMYTTFYMIVTAAYGLLFELIIRKLFAPIAVADFVSEGMRSPGARYLKNYFGVYIRMAIFAAVIALGYAASSWAYTYPDAARQINTNLGKIGVLYCVRFAMKALISASGQTTKEIMGG